MEYDRELLIRVLVYHQPTNTSGCICGWGKLAHSHPEHVIDTYEEAMRYGLSDKTVKTFPMMTYLERRAYIEALDLAKEIKSTRCRRRDE